MKYEFHAGDYVETKTGTIGFITNVVDIENKQPHWMPTRLSSVDIRDDLYSLDESYCMIEKDVERRFKRIGQYDFTKKDNDKIKLLPKEYNDLYSKINELVEAVNQLEEKVNGMA